MGFTKEQLEHGLKTKQLAPDVPNGMSISDMIRATTGNNGPTHTEESGSAKTAPSAVSPGTTTKPVSKRGRKAKINQTKSASTGLVILLFAAVVLAALIVVIAALQ